MPKVHEHAVWSAYQVYDEYVVHRCNRWGKFERWSVKFRSRLLQNGAPCEVTSWWGPIVLEGNVEQTGFESLHDVCPVNVEEALETRACVALLPDRLKDAVWQEHVRPGRTQREKAETLGINRRVFRHRLETAYPLLLTFMDVSGGDHIVDDADLEQ